MSGAISWAAAQAVWKRGREQEAAHPPTPEFTTIEMFTIANRGSVHVVANPNDVDPRTLVDKLVRLDGEMRKVTAVESPAVPWAPGMKAFRHLGLLVREQR